MNSEFLADLNHKQKIHREAERRRINLHLREIDRKRAGRVELAESLDSAEKRVRALREQLQEDSRAISSEGGLRSLLRTIEIPSVIEFKAELKDRIRRGAEAGSGVLPALTLRLVAALNKLDRIKDGLITDDDAAAAIAKLEAEIAEPQEATA